MIRQALLRRAVWQVMVTGRERAGKFIVGYTKWWSVPLESHREPDEELEKISTAVKPNNTGKFLLFSNPYVITKQLVYFARRKTQWRYSLELFHSKVIIFRKSWTWLELSCLTYQPQHCGYFQIKENPCFVVNSNISFLIFKRMDTIIMIRAND